MVVDVESICINHFMRLSRTKYVIVFADYHFFCDSRLIELIDHFEDECCGPGNSIFCDIEKKSLYFQ